MNKLLLALFVWMISPSAQAAPNFCGLSVNVSNVTLVWNQNFTFQAITLTVSKSKIWACSYSLTFSRGGASSYNNRRMVSGANQLPYQLYKDSALTKILREVPDITSSNDYISGSFPFGFNQTQTVTYYVQIPVSAATIPSYKPSGTYSDTYFVRLYEGTPSASESPEDSASTQITTVIPKIIDLSITPPGGTFNPGQTMQNLNFGNLTQGESQSVSLKVRTNAGYTVSMSSQYNSALAHTTPSSSSRVPYSIKVNSVPRNLVGSATSPVVVATGPGQTGTSGISLPVDITIGSPANAMAGNYIDNITVTVATTE